MQRRQTFLAQSRATKLFIALIGALIIVRFLFLLWTPPGFFMDEAATGAHVVAMLHNWTNAHGQSWPLFSAALGGGYTTPIYLYPLVGWAAVFGTSEFALRCFSEVATIAAVLIFGVAVKAWLGKRDAAIATIIGLTLPWGWLQASLAWDPALVPLFVAVGFLSFTRLYFGGSLRSKITYLLLFPAALLCLAYLYPPMRITAPLLFVGGYLFLWLYHRVDVRSIVITCLIAGLLSLPLLQFMIEPAALERSQTLSVFHDTSIIGGIGRVVTNLILLLNPLFLFVYGDANLRHATGFEGMLGVASIIPLAGLIFYAVKKWHIAMQAPFGTNLRVLLWIASFGTIASLLGSAFTNEGQPHSLRATAAWLFIVLLITIGWRIILALKIRYIVITATAIAIISIAAYAIDLTVLYPYRAAASFDVAERQAIRDGRPSSNYPDLAQKYYKTR